MFFCLSPREGAVVFAGERRRSLSLARAEEKDVVTADADGEKP